jgi:hypothetical protein
MTKTEMDEEAREAAVYSIWRTGNKHRRVYQINKMMLDIMLDQYWVELRGHKKVHCDCMGFQRQSFPAIEHKHIKIAMDFAERGEPVNAKYRIHGTGAKTEIEYLGANND